MRIDQAEPSWIRLYPVRFRGIDDDLQFKKYERVDLPVQAHGSRDPRVESHRPDQSHLDRVGVIDTKTNWAHRRNLLGGLIGATTTCALRSANEVRMNEPSPSLGLIKPRIDEVQVLPGEPWNEKQIAKIQKASEPDLFGPGLAPLEPMPYIVRYRYRCESAECPTHTQKVLDWELGQAGRLWRRKHGDQRAREMIREKWEDEFCDPSRDLHFFIGNQHQHRRSFSILGCWYPKIEKDREDLTLF
ncbi:hypothetical protein M1M07_28400 [Rhodococcus sp. HM1]|uniref:hypothetical protein n=1 Tax=Rhodococcus sp. HM1 TaxID=2937759 RepID=UPI00200B6C02|nr:hypothetical protein [Rhodococcus sp. HM1]MCK8675016.1 hypothetical protein [Rhodococcus sp. HM1]